jgi:hypothetical protein
VAKASNFLGLIEDIRMYFQLSHHTELSEMLENFIASDGGFGGD